MATTKPVALETRVRALFDYHTEGYLIWREPPQGRKLGQRAGCVLRNQYVQVMVDHRRYLVHRLIWLWHHGVLPRQLDHIDRNRANNRIENLRPATLKENAGNRGKSEGKSSRWKGVHWCNTIRRWVASLQAKTGKQHLGAYDDEADAAMAYNEAALVYFGAFAHLNCANQEMF